MTDWFIILTCSPKIASGIDFDFSHFIPELSQVKTDRSGKRKKGEKQQRSK